MAAEQFVDRLNEQIANEFAAAQQYLAVAVYYDALTLPQLAQFFYRQSLEERGHALMMVQYLLDADATVRIPGLAEPRLEFADLVEPVRISLEQERRVSDQITALALLAREQGDLLSEQFMQWFLKEQVEEVSTMSDLLAVVERSGDQTMFIEDYIVRELAGGSGGDPTAPIPAGG